MNAKELIIDFINYVFLLFLVCFCITYFIIGDRFNVFGEFLRAFLPFSMFGVFFLIRFKIKRKVINSIDDGKENNEIISYFSREDRLRDNIIITSLPFVILMIGFFDKSFDYLDLVQALMAYFYMRLWHNYLFRSEENISQLINLKRSDKEKDEIAIYFLPVLISGVAMAKSGTNITLDFVQALSCFTIMIVWHLILFKEKNY